MPTESAASVRSCSRDFACESPEQVPQLVESMLQAARDAGASDVHLVPDRDALAMQWRIDGVLHAVERFPRTLAPNIVARLKVLADLLTYRCEVPQEGRIHADHDAVEMRVSTFPTLFGEKVVVRLFVGSGRFRRLPDLGLPADIADRLPDLLLERGGLLLVTGPAGSGKTTTAYAALRELADGMRMSSESGGERSLVSIEDPVEAVVSGVAQSQVQPAAGFTYDVGLRSLLRQDPDVILVGEIRDPTSAELVFQAALAGHLVLSTYHAGSAMAALHRLSDMGIEPYQLRSGLLAVLSQRLARRLCGCAVVGTDDRDRLGLALEDVRLPHGCNNCGNTGYRGRLLLAEMLDRTEIAAFERSPAGTPTRADRPGSLGGRGLDAVRQGLTSPAEFRRVFGGNPGNNIL